jgi:hypothetical protein
MKEEKNKRAFERLVDKAMEGYVRQHPLLKYS